MGPVSSTMGIWGWLIFPVVYSIVAIVLGHAALAEIDRSEGQIGGRGTAQAGLILGCVALGVALLSVALFVVLPIPGCGFCSICGVLSSLFQG